MGEEGFGGGGFWGGYWFFGGCHRSFLCDED